MSGYQYYHQMFSDELTCRPDSMRNHIQRGFNLPQQVQVVLDVFPANGGKINISTVTPDNYPWNGIYFDGVPVKIEAQASTGYRFSHWEANGLISDTLNPVFLDTLATNSTNFRAHFISTVGVNDINPSALTVYPNPAAQFINIKISETALMIAQVSLYDLVGREYNMDFSIVGSEELQLSLSKLPAGIYLIKCINRDGKSYLAEFVKL